MKYMSDNKNQAWILKLEKSSVHSLVIVLSWYHHQPESHQQSFTKLPELETPGPIDRTPETPGSGKKSLGPEPHQLTNASYVESGEVMSICVNEARQYLNIYI